MTRVRPWFVCSSDPHTLTLPNAECANAAAHTPRPDGYIAASEWADEMMQTHDQHRCPTCGLWLTWTPKADTA